MAEEKLRRFKPEFLKLIEEIERDCPMTDGALMCGGGHLEDWLAALGRVRELRTNFDGIMLHHIAELRRILRENGRPDVTDLDAFAMLSTCIPERSLASGWVDLHEHSPEELVRLYDELDVPYTPCPHQGRNGAGT